MSVDKLLKAIGKESDITRLEYFRDTGINILINTGKDVGESDRTVIVQAINDKIIELGGTI